MQSSMTEPWITDAVLAFDNKLFSSWIEKLYARLTRHRETVYDGYLNVQKRPAEFMKTMSDFQVDLVCARVKATNLKVRELQPTKDDLYWLQCINGLLNEACAFHRWVEIQPLPYACDIDFRHLMKALQESRDVFDVMLDELSEKFNE